MPFPAFLDLDHVDGKVSYAERFLTIPLTVLTERFLTQRRSKAAERLGALAEAGDTAAEDAILDDGKAFLQGLYDAGLLSDKVLKAVMGPPRSY